MKHITFFITLLIFSAVAGIRVNCFANQEKSFTLFPVDFGVTAITAPVSSPNLGNNETVTITIKNFGTIPQQNISLSYSVNGGVTVVETCTMYISPGAAYNYHFTTTADLSAFGEYTIVACTALQGDEDPSNDCFTTVVTHSELNDVGVLTLESPATGAGFSNAEAVSVTIKNFGNTAQSNFPVSVSITGPNGNQLINAVYSGTLAPNTVSPAFSTGIADMHLFGNYTLNACTNLAGDDVVNNDCQLATVTNNPPLKVLNTISPVSGSGLTASEPLTINLQNIGNSTILAGMPINYSVTGNPIVSGSWTLTDPLSAGATISQTIANLDMQLFGTYSLTICPFYEGNTYPNSGCYSYQVVNDIPAVSDTFWPQDVPLWTGSTNGSVFTQNSLIHFSSGNTENGWAKFDLSEIPSVLQINSVNLHYYTQSQTGNPNFRIKPLLTDPLTSSASAVMSAISMGQGYITVYDGYTTGWHTYNLGSAAKADLLSQWANHWFAVGFNEYETCVGCYYGSIQGWQETNTPYLEVNYTSPLAHDVAMNSILLPPYIPIGPFVPTAMVHNYGTSPETFTATLTATGGYTSSVTVINLLPGENSVVTFSTYTAPQGDFCLTASVNLDGDLNFGNNTKQHCSSNVIYPNVFGIVSYKNTAGTIITDSTFVWLTYDNPPGLILMDTVDAEGNYLFENLTAGSYSLHVTSQKTWGGCNASDALMILKHFVGMSYLSGLNLAAADINTDGHVTSIDALLVLKRFTMVIPAFPAPDWVSDMQQVIMPPSQYAPVNLKVLCTGDVNGTYVP